MNARDRTHDGNIPVGHTAAIEDVEELARSDIESIHRLARLGVVRVKVAREAGKHVLTMGEQRHLRPQLARKDVFVHLTQHLIQCVLNQNITINIPIERIARKSTNR